jgi:hypothetical protein
MAELFGKNEQLAVRNFQVLGRWRDRGAIRLRYRHRCADNVYPNRNATLLFDLPDGHRAIRAIQHSFN